MSNPRFTIAQLRRELMELAESVTGYAPPPKPDRFERDNQSKVGPEWHVQHPNPLLKDMTRIVRVIEGEPEVFMEGGAYMNPGDMDCLTTHQARAYAMALLAAADWADGMDILGQRRSQQGAK